MDPLADRLIELVKDGAGLAKTARECGIGAEQVRRLLGQEAIDARAQVAGQAKRVGISSPIPPALAPAIEAMWREGMLYHEIAEVFDSSCEAVHRLIRARVPAPERAAAEGRELERSPEERLLCGMRAAAKVLPERSDVSPERRSPAGVVARQDADQLTLNAAAVAPSALSPPGRPTAAALRVELDRFKADLRAAGLRESTIRAYLLGSSLFVRWLAGDYVPGPRRAKPAPARATEAPS